MKSIFTFFFLLVLSISTYSQRLSGEELYKYKVKRYSKMKDTGRNMGLIGCGATVAGVLLITGSEWEESTDRYGNTIKEPPAGFFLGIVSIYAGIPVCVTGIVLNSVGKRKKAYYQNLLDHVDLNYYQNGKHKGFNLAVRF